jgi:DNA-binding response OmpR family regulator
MVAAPCIWPGPVVVATTHAHPFAALIGRRILVVEDCEEVAALIRDTFTSCGAIVAVANSGERAIWPLANEQVDLVALDFSLPGQSGWDVLQFIKCVSPSLMGRTLFLTGRRYEEGVLAAIRRSRIPCLLKPFGIDELRDVACSLLGTPRPAMVA